MLKIKKYMLEQGDCIEVMKGISNKSIDAILCDLPYGTTDCHWDNIISFDQLWKQYNRIIKDNGVVILFSAQPFTTKLISSNIKNYRYSWYWIKNKSTGFVFAKHQPMRKLEEINIFYKRKPLYVPQGLIELKKPIVKRRIFSDSDSIYKQNTLLKEHEVKYTNYPNNILYFDKETKNIHPTQKPIELLRYLIRTYTREGDTILDNCMGSGSTGIACALEDRKFIGIELDEVYFKEAKVRIERAYNKLQ